MSIVHTTTTRVTRVRSHNGPSRRNRSGTRSRSRNRESQSRSRSRSHLRLKPKERNFPAAICSMISIVVLCVAMAEPKWISLKGGGCRFVHTRQGSLRFLGVYQFLYGGSLERNYRAGSVQSELWYQYGPADDEVMVNCVDSRSVLLFKVVITFCFLAILSSLTAFLLDLTGPSGRILQRLHRNAIFSIVSVAFCVVLNIFCYLITSLVESLQSVTKLHHGSKVDVTFDISFYLISAAGAFSVFAVACNCFRRYPSYEEPAYHQFEDCDDFESLISPNIHDMSAMSNMPPPPAYTPSPNMPSTSATHPEPGSATPTDTAPSTPSPPPSALSQTNSVNV